MTLRNPRRKWASGAAMMMAVVFSSSAQSQICEINLAGRLGISKEGNLYVDMKGAGIVAICSMSGTDRGISKEACTGWYSALLSLKMAHARAQFYFNGSEPANSGVVQCSQLGDWTVRTPYFLETIP